LSDSVEHLRKFFESLGLTEDVDVELAKTPERVDALIRELFSGLDAEQPVLSLFDATQDTEPVLIEGIPFKSTCAHHLLPILGHISIAYVPGSSMAGFGGFARIIDHWSKRPQVQERLVEEICNDLHEQLEPRGILVCLQARQLCVEMRSDRAASLYTSIASRGILESGPLRSEILRTFDAS